MKRALPAAAALGVALTLAACGGSEAPSTPSACLDGADAYLSALAGAPEDVALADGTPISSCIVEEQGSGQLNTIGTSLVEAATRLNAEAAKDPGGDAAVQLGYLVGAVEEGASGTAGLHTDLVRRLNSAARTSDDPEGLGAEFERTYGSGYAAAREAG
jgi:hypothetical protein